MPRSKKTARKYLPKPNIGLDFPQPNARLKTLSIGKAVRKLGVQPSIRRPILRPNAESLKEIRIYEKRVHLHYNIKV